ncbi:MAG: hypothetical protein WBR13_08900 [Allosphingosinicella sp.]
MARHKAKSRKVRAPLSAPSSAAIPIWKKPWLWLAGSIAALALLLTNINSILSNARALPSEARKTSEQFFEWYGEYDAWKGHWTNFPEGLVDMAELNLSQEDFRIDIDEIKNGAIAGMIESKGICEKTPFFERFSIEGNISNASIAKINVFDYVDGYKRIFAQLTLRRKGGVMTVIPDADPMGAFNQETRIALDPDEFKGDDDRLPICADKSEKFIMDALNKVRKEEND